MKVESIVFTSSIPEVTRVGGVYQIDFGVVRIELTTAEIESLVVHIGEAIHSDYRVDLRLKERG